MLHVHKKNSALAVVLALALTGGSATVSAEVILNANDLSSATLTAETQVESFVITARPDKDVQIKVLGVARTAEDGEIFNNCIDLRGGGAVDYRSVKFTTAKEGTILTVYLNSGSSSAARVLRLVDTAGTVVFEFPAAPYVEGTASMAETTIAAPGSYYLTSASSGILIYQIKLN